MNWIAATFHCVRCGRYGSWTLYQLPGQPIERRTLPQLCLYCTEAELLAARPAFPLKEQIACATTPSRA